MIRKIFRYLNEMMCYLQHFKTEAKGKTQNKIILLTTGEL